jgi:uncharacterized cupredoxin-like copper-binding protein
MNRRRRHLVLAAALAGLAASARAHGEGEHKKPASPIVKEQKDWGIAGEGARAKRTIAVRMLDTMRFEPAHIDVRLDETVRFTVRNTGKVMHEFVIGTKAENEAHAALMMKFPDMEHDEPYMAHVAPGKTERIVWQFTKPGEFYYGCLVPGHFEAGMIGKLIVK